MLSIRSELTTRQLFGCRLSYPFVDMNHLTAFREENDIIDGDGINYSNNDDNTATVLFGALIPSSFQQVLSRFLPPRHKASPSL